MYRTHLETAPESRRGIILLVVLFWLTLLAIAGIGMVVYADAESTAARLRRDAAAFPQPDMEPELALSFFLGQLLYDCPDDESGIYSALRGHGLLRNMFGLNTAFDPARNQWVLLNNHVPYHGPGRLHTGPGSYLNPFSIDDHLLINYKHFPADGFLRDPERHAMRRSPADPRGPYVGGNVGYTYPDLNTLFLAAARADGTVLIPSFHRPWLFNPGRPLNDMINNPNWTNVAGKYLTLRPRPIDHLGFPPPEDATGDVRNWPWAPGGNDSIWIDIGAPVLTAPDGRKYKMLVAPLIIDLDNRLNVNVHGNTLGGPNFDHRSSQGLGHWEVNLGRVLNADPNEWKNLVLGRPYNGAPAWLGRLGANRLPLNGGQAPPLPATPHLHAPIDLDARDEATGAPTGPVQLPAAGPTAFRPFPVFPAGYGNGSAAERTDHPLRYNVLRSPAFTAANDDRVFGPANMAALLRVFDTSSEALLGSDLVRLCPLNLNDPADPIGSARRRHLLTTLSFDLDRPGTAPWVWDRNDPATAYRHDAARGHPRGEPIPFPDPARRIGPQPASTEFNPNTWQSAYAPPGRLNLDRPLTAYPRPDAATGRITDLATYNAAHGDRQLLARDLFERLRRITGAVPIATATPNTDEYRALRWLAQLAVNIVDYLDEDDYLTIFRWNPNDAAEVAYGTELPRLVLNEAYVQLDNLANNGGGTATGYNVNIWIELYNPQSASPTLTDNGDAVLQVPNGGSPYAAYQVVLTRRDNNLRGFTNAAGDPDPAAVIKTLTSWGADPTRWAVRPSNGGYSGPAGGTQGFCVAGPQVAFQPNADPMLPATITSDQLTYSIPADDQQIQAEPPRPTILLRRLACPHLPLNNNPAAAEYNPYITVDYLEDMQSSDGRRFNAAGAALTPLAITERASWGKNQPFAAHVSQRIAQAPAMPAANQPKHTFYRHNGVEDAAPPAAGAGQTLKVPFDWLVHLDRPPVSPVELLHVSAFKPHELTQQFVAPTAADPTVIAPFQHYAPWLDASARISRLFGFVANKDRYLDTAPGGRVPGKINLSTVWDEEVFLALCDPGPSNHFTVADVRAAWQRFLAQRSPSGAPGPAGVPLPAGVSPDRPLLDPSTGYTLPGQQYPGGISLADTLLSPGLFFDPNSTAHPYVKYELLNKIWNHVTVRSNVFAVWVTVGFFEVMDDSTRPVKLGPEIGRAEGRHVRHRMFAIVDRTDATVFGYQLGTNLAVEPGGAGRQVRFRSLRPPDPLSGVTPGGLRWNLEPGVPLTFDPDTGIEETALVTGILSSGATPGPDVFEVGLQGTRPANARIIGRGNAGPWPGYDPRRDERLVRFWAVIE